MAARKRQLIGTKQNACGSVRNTNIKWL